MEEASCMGVKTSGVLLALKWVQGFCMDISSFPKLGLVFGSNGYSMLGSILGYSDVGKSPPGPLASYN